LLLEDWIQHFTHLVLKAREEMSRKHEHEMRETEALKAAIMEASLDAIVTLNRAGEIIDYNPMAESMLRFSPRRRDHRPTSPALSRPGDHAAFVGMLQESGAGRSAGPQPHARGELWARRADGSASRWRSPSCPSTSTTSASTPSTSTTPPSARQAEREIKGLARFASESPNPILRVNGEGLIVYANAASLPLTGCLAHRPRAAAAGAWIERGARGPGEGQEPRARGRPG
jgi:two-component system sensor kinase FixL